MKTTICSAFFGLIWMPVFSQQNVDAYKAEADGYFIHPVQTSAGTIATDNLCSRIYLIKNGEAKELVAAPGCGRYFSLSPDKSKVGFKLIKPDGMQVPALFDLVSNELTELSVPVQLCGQVSMTADGRIAYTIAHNLIVINGKKNKTIDLGVYANYAPVSPDGNYVVYNSDNDQLFCIDLSTNKKMQITDNNGGYMYPQWSPDGNNVLYSSLSGTLVAWNKNTNTSHVLGAGTNATWSDDSKFILFDRATSVNFQLTASDLYCAKADGSVIVNLTNTTDTHEMFPAFAGNGTLLFSTYNKMEILAADINLQQMTALNKTTLIKNQGPLLSNANYYGTFHSAQKNPLSIAMVQGTVPYIHQMYDTPDWHGGSGSCAPTTSNMAVAYYNRLPYWDITASWPSPHTSHYGAYVADLYRYNEIYYNVAAGDANSNNAWGGYGYMWNGSNSPNSTMAAYLQSHGLTSVHSYNTVYTDVTAEINASYPFPICNTLTTAGHLTLAVGYVNGQHTLIFNDPYGNKNTGSWPNYTGTNSYYDWPGYNNGYQNLNSMAWTVTAESSEPAYNDTIIDDVSYNHGFYIYNQGVSHMKYFHDKTSGGYNSHFWYTITSSSTTVDTCYVTWTPTLATAGNYEVFAYIPSSNANATAARYKVNYLGGNQTVVINQASFSNQWVSLGTFPFAQGNAGSVRLGDAAGAAGQSIAFDAVKFAGVPPVSLGMTEIKTKNIKIYPNPATEELFIDGLQAYRIKIIDLLGQTVLEKTQTNNLDVSKLAKGVYSLLIYNNQEQVIYTDKVVKE